MLRPVGQADHGQGFRRSLTTFGLVDLGVQRRQLGIFERRRPCQKIESLKNKTNLLVPNQRESLLVVLRNINAFKQVTSGTRPVQTPQHVHERRFATAAGPHDRDELGVPDFDADAPQSVHPRFAEVVILVHFLDDDDDTVS